MGSPDPSASESDIQWRQFVDWIRLQCEKDGHFTRRQQWANIRAACFAADSRWLGVWHAAKKMLFCANAPGVLSEKLCGSRLPARLAAEWVALCSGKTACGEIA